MSNNIVPPISDGQPVTYQFLNDIVNAVNKLGKTESGESSQDIEFNGVSYSLSKTDSVIVAVGRFNIPLKGVSEAVSAVNSKTVSFNSNFKSPPIVFLSAVDETAGRSNETSYVSLVATDISKSAFTCKVRRTLSSKKPQDADTLTINFLAIGPAPS